VGRLGKILLKSLYLSLTKEEIDALAEKVTTESLTSREATKNTRPREMTLLCFTAKCL